MGQFDKELPILLPHEVIGALYMAGWLAFATVLLGGISECIELTGELLVLRMQCTQTIRIHIDLVVRVFLRPGPVDMDSCSGPWGPTNYPYPPALAGEKPDRASGYG
jgi:hypothetical protein